MGKFVIIEHPLIADKIAKLRSVETGKKDFRELVEEITMLVCYEASKDLPLEDIEVETPICTASGKKIGVKIGIISILRAGIGMENGLLNLFPTARVGHVGLYRDPDTLKPVEYYCKIPVDSSEREIFLVDPMLATGGTASMAIAYLKKAQVKKIRLLCLISCPEGVERIKAEHPDVDIYTSAHDLRLNEHGYIIPGLGDAGDRLFGTK